MVTVRLPYTVSGSKKFENILSIRVLKWLVILVDHKIKGMKELEAGSKNSFV